MKQICWNDNWTFEMNQGGETAVSLPHDASQAVGRTEDGISGTGGAFFNGGAYTYKKTFTVPDSWDGKSVTIELEGVYPDATVFLDDKELGACTYGYLGYFFEFPEMAAGETHTVSVHVDDTKRPNSRWYPGAGMYRPVRVYVGDQIHILPEGIRVETLSTNPAEIEVRTEFAGKAGKVAVQINKDDTLVTEGEGKSVRLSVPEAKLWSAEHPDLYTCVVTLLDEAGNERDSASVSFGIRKVTWSPKGFFVNGEETLLKGGCLHHDHGVVGARALLESEYRRVKKLKEFGFNAIRSSHNPASKALLTACDELGMYVMDEGWDMWYQSKTPYDYATKFMDHWRLDMEAMISKDYNHPSVVMYSIGNEVTEPAEEKGNALAHEIADAFRAADPTRAVTAGINITLVAMMKMGINMTEMNDEAAKERSKDVNSTKYNEMAQENAERMNQAAATDGADALTADLFSALDIAGYNYAASRYPIEGEKHPERVVVGSETYAYKLAENWEMVEKYPYLIGDFMWTAWDYIGENGIGAWTWEEDGASFFKGYPWLLGDSGAIDILGQDNAEAGHAAVIWGAKPIYVGVVPANHPGEELKKAMWRGTNARPFWSYKNCEGNPTQVEVYGTGKEAGLTLNGKDLGRKELVRKKAVFDVLYEPGELKAVLYDEAGNVLAGQALTSADADTRIRLTAEPKNTKDDIYYIDVELVGANGVLECNADETLTVSVSGGELLGFGSANPKTPENFKDGKYTTYYGQSQAVLKKTDAKMTITVCGETLSKQELVIGEATA